MVFHFETVTIHTDQNLLHLFHMLQFSILSCHNLFSFIIYVLIPECRTPHLAKCWNRLLATVTVTPSDAIQQASALHATFHENASLFCKQFLLTRQRAQLHKRGETSPIKFTPHIRLHLVLCTINILNCNRQETTAVERQFSQVKETKLGRIISKDLYIG